MKRYLKIPIFFSIIIIISTLSLFLLKLGFNGVKGFYNVGIAQNELYYSENYDYFFSKNDTASIKKVILTIEKDNFELINQLGDTFILEKDDQLFNLTKKSFLNHFYIWDLTSVE
ncbi:hypothetical protein M4I33_06215 [Clostridium sp. LY3-2]|uniref:hypothetical protein n=1 Tax=Clostridium sp. LY3-2 TaxID=2942482 RepID=UPI002152A263|nr:hypothetical protein [Clostridium sp. LY3-2]MCR6514474.1 hypothetical protein [Clostridium sp. LY3-2]